MNDIRAWFTVKEINEWAEKKLAEQPASKPWVGLTDEETGHWAADFLAGAKWAEAKLREKNGG